MKQRILSGAVLVAFFAAIIVFNQSFPLALNIAVALISAASIFELTKALGLARKWFLVFRLWLRLQRSILRQGMKCSFWYTVCTP